MLRIMLFLMLFIVPAAAPAADKPLGVEEFSSLDELAFAIAGDFPKVQGEVSAVQGDRVTLSFGAKDGLAPGMQLAVWRVAKEVLHPVTNAVIGRTENEIASVEITSVADASSSAVVVKKQVDLRPGDKARITPRKIGIAVLPVKGRPETAAELAGLLAGTGRFTLADEQKVAGLLQGRKVLDAGVVRDAGRILGVDAVVALSVFPSEGKTIAVARVMTAPDARLLDTIVAQVSTRPRQESISDIKPFFTPEQEEKPAVSGDLPLSGRRFVQGDFDGDGRPEVAVSDGVKVLLLRQESGGWRELWADLPEGVSYKEVQHLSLDASDINGNGRTELFVTALVGNKVIAHAVEWQDGAYRRTVSMTGFLRVVSFPGRGSVLIGQDFAEATFFAGPVREYAWNGSTYAPGAALPLPEEVNLYNFVLADLGESRVMMAALDADDRLVLYSGGAKIWRSEEQYLGVDIAVMRPLAGVELMTKSKDEYDRTRVFRVKQRMQAVDVNGDRKDEIVLAKHGGMLPSFLGVKEGTVRVLRWTGTRMDEVWSSPATGGAVPDLAVSRAAGGGVEVRALVTSSSGLFSKATERLTGYLVK